MRVLWLKRRGRKKWRWIQKRSRPSEARDCNEICGSVYCSQWRREKRAGWEIGKKCGHSAIRKKDNYFLM
jgi:hypothetical protein